VTSKVGTSGAGPSWAERLESQESLHRLDPRRPHRARARRSHRGRSSASSRRHRLHPGLHLRIDPRHPDGELLLDVTVHRLWLPVERSWRLNERHYGALQGLDKAETVAQHGADQVKIRRRSKGIRPACFSAGTTRAYPRARPAIPGLASFRASGDSTG
jgi:hypothetical protein